MTTNPKSPEPILGEFIREKRQEAGISRSKLSQLAHISPSEIQRIEIGVRKTPSLKSLQAIATALNIPMEELLSKSNIPDTDIPTPLEQAFPDLTEPWQKEMMQNFARGLARNGDLNVENQDVIKQQMEIAFNYVESKKDTK